MDSRKYRIVILLVIVAKSAGTLNRRHEIELWQSSLHPETGENVSPGIIGSVFDGLMAFLRSVLETLKQQKLISPGHQLLERASAALPFWGLDFGNSIGELDFALQCSNEVRDMVLAVVSFGDTGHKSMHGTIFRLLYLSVSHHLANASRKIGWIFVRNDTT